MDKKVLCILAEGFEEIEAITPIDLLRRADIEVITAGLTGIDITGAHGISVIADCDLEEALQQADDFDAVIVPGGMPGAANIAANTKAVDFIKKMFKAEKITAAICAAPGLVFGGAAGILNGKKFTCYPGFETKFDLAGSKASYTGENVTVDGNLITAKGFSAAIEFSEAIVKKLTETS